MSTGIISTHQAREGGRQAFRQGVSGCRKPYPTTTPQGEAWVDGWMEAQTERLEAERNGTWNTPASEASAKAEVSGSASHGRLPPHSPAGGGHSREQPPAGAFFAGHNSGAKDVADTQGITGDQLKSYIERIEKLEGEIADLNADKREVYSEAKANGFDTKVMRHLIQLRRKDPQDRSEQEELLHVYKSATGME